MFFPTWKKHGCTVVFSKLETTQRHSHVYSNLAEKTLLRRILRQEGRDMTTEAVPITSEARASMHRGPGHVRAAMVRRRPAASWPADMGVSQQVSSAGTGRLGVETDWWGGDDNMLHRVMRAYQLEKRGQTAA